MNESNLNCPKCAGEMEDGFIADYYDDDRIKPSDWVEGEPVKALWTGTKINDKKQYRVQTFRCVRCGYLESYAAEYKSR